MKKYRIIFFALLNLLPAFVSQAFERDVMYARTLRILQLSHNQGDYASYAQMMEMYQDMRDKIKSDLALGNVNTAVDYELLAEGLILENYQALQSLLGFNNYRDTTKEFSDEIDRTYAQKLAYALKQNKIAFQTHFDVKKSAEQASCKIVLNGKELQQFSFIGPAGVPFYIGIYCSGKMFEVKKILAAESQKFYTITFNNLKPIIYQDDPVEMGIPNPYSSKKQAAKNFPSRLGLFGQKDMQISTGAGVDWYVSYDVNNYYNFSPASTAMLLYSSTQFSYKHFEFVFDLGPVIKTVQTDPVVIEKEHTIFVRPIFLYTDGIYRYKDIFTLNANLGFSTFFVGKENAFLSPVSFGIKAGLEPKLYLYKSFFLGGDLGITYYFAGPTSNIMLVGTALRLGADL